VALKFSKTYDNCVVLQLVVLRSEDHMGWLLTFLVIPKHHLDVQLHEANHGEEVSPVEGPVKWIVSVVVILFDNQLIFTLNAFGCLDQSMQAESS
jgi:hypothetical protein